MRGLDGGRGVLARTEAPAASLAQALGLDMHDWWTPTAAGYFEHVSKAKALEAVSVIAPAQVTRLSKLKKGDLASEAEHLVAGTGWLPSMLCKAEDTVELEADLAAQGRTCLPAEEGLAHADAVE